MLRHRNNPPRILVVIDQPALSRAVFRSLHRQGLGAGARPAQISSLNRMLADETVDLVIAEPRLLGAKRRRREPAGGPRLPHLLAVLHSGRLPELNAAADICDGFVFSDLNLDRLAELIALADSGICALPAGLFPFPDTRQMQRRRVEGLAAGDRRLLELLTTGKPLREIAAQLGMPEPAARRDLRRILLRLGARTKTEAALLWARAGLERGSSDPQTA